MRIKGKLMWDRLSKLENKSFFLLKTIGNRRPRSPFRSFLIEIAIGKRKVGRNAKVRFFPLSAAARSTERGGGSLRRRR